MPQSCSGPYRPVEISGIGPQSQVSRRAVLRGLGAGAAALAAAPVLLAGTRAAAATAAAKAALPGAAGTLAGLHGATLSLAAFPSGTTWPQAIADWDGYTGTTIKVAKVYYTPGTFPTSINSEIGTYISEGIKALLSFKPAYNPPTKTDLVALENALQMFLSAGLTAAVTVWQEPQHVMTAAQFRQVVHYYGPAVRKYYPLAYDVTAAAGPSAWTKYYPGASSIDLVAADYYANTYVSGVTLDVIAGLADSASPPQPFGLWEIGSSATNTSPTQSQVESFFGYIQSFMAGRLQAGKANADIVWYDVNGANTISSSSDYRVPLWDSLVNATS
jgi:hypothetical protein